jgi:YggT family protein
LLEVLILVRLIELYSLIVVAAMILSWVPTARHHPIGRFIESVTEPALGRIRNVVPPVGGFDLSPMILLLALRMLEHLLFL